MVRNRIAGSLHHSKRAPGSSQRNEPHVGFIVTLSLPFFKHNTEPQVGFIIILLIKITITIIFSLFFSEMWQFCEGVALWRPPSEKQGWETRF